MKKTVSVILFLFIVLFSGCTVKETLPLECVSDTHFPPQMPAFYMSADIPHGTFLSDSCNEGCCALYTHDDYEVMQEIFRAENLDEAFVYLTGKTQEYLKPLIVSRFPQDEYRFAWSAVGEDGPLSCSGMLFYDGTYYYSLCILCDAEFEKNYREDFSDIFAGTQLFPI